MNAIYGHGANFLKDGWYDGGAGTHRNMGDTRDKAEHQFKRKKLAHVFAQKTIVSLEREVKSMVEVLNSEIDKRVVSSQVINIRRYLNYFTIDLISKLLYGESLSCIRRGNDIVCAETRAGKLYQTSLIDALHLSMSINTSLGMEAPLLPYTKKIFALHPYRRAGGRFEDIVYHNAMKRLRKTEPQDDFFAKLLVNNQGEELNLTQGEILAESGVILNAGSDTTTSALTSTIFLLYKHPKVLSKLRRELDAKLHNEEVPSYELVSTLPYLRACIEESLRLRPASSLGLPRVVPAGGRIIAGRFIEEGVTVSVPTYTLLRDPQSFSNPDVYDPDRWITGDKEKMMKAHLPFSTGPRACIGRNIAYLEQLILIATLAHRYEFELPSSDFELENIERFNSNPGELPVRVKHRAL
jgi:cytochrome P450